MCISPPIRGFSCILSPVHVTTYCGLWPPGNTTYLFLTWYQSVRFRSSPLVAAAAARLGSPPPRPTAAATFSSDAPGPLASRTPLSSVFSAPVLGLLLSSRGPLPPPLPRTPPVRSPRGPPLQRIGAPVRPCSVRLPLPRLAPTAHPPQPPSARPVDLLGLPDRVRRPPGVRLDPPCYRLGSDRPVPG
jgi:hypothetical protein